MWALTRHDHFVDDSRRSDDNRMRGTGPGLVPYRSFSPPAGAPDAARHQQSMSAHTTQLSSHSRTSDGRSKIRASRRRPCRSLFALAPHPSGHAGLPPAGGSAAQHDRIWRDTAKPPLSAGVKSIMQTYGVAQGTAELAVRKHGQLVGSICNAKKAHASCHNR